MKRPNQKQVIEQLKANGEVYDPVFGLVHVSPHKTPKGKSVKKFHLKAHENLREAFNSQKKPATKVYAKTSPRS